MLIIIKNLNKILVFKATFRCKALQHGNTKEFKKNFSSFIKDENLTDILFA